MSTRPEDIRIPNVECYARHALVRTRGVYALCEGVLHPRVLVDREAEMLPGFEALMYHEGTHAYEYHTLLDLIIVGSCLVAGALGVGLQSLWPIVYVPVGVALWFWWRREREIRADSIALAGAGLPEYRGMLNLHKHPKGWFWSWVYGKSIAHREVRAKRRCARRGWSY